LAKLRVQSEKKTHFSTAQIRKIQNADSFRIKRVVREHHYYNAILLNNKRKPIKIIKWQPRGFNRLRVNEIVEGYRVNYVEPPRPPVPPEEVFNELAYIFEEANPHNKSESFLEIKLYLTDSETRDFADLCRFNHYSQLDKENYVINSFLERATAHEKEVYALFRASDTFQSKNKAHKPRSHFRASFNQGVVTKVNRRKYDFIATYGADAGDFEKEDLDNVGGNIYYDSTR
jgi:hypothetical protein